MSREETIIRFRMGMRLARRLVGLVLLWFAVSGCGPQSLIPRQDMSTPAPNISVLDLCGLSPESFAAMEEAEVRLWLTNKYGVVPTERPKSKVDRDDEKVLYVVGRNRESTAFLRGGRVSSIINSNWDSVTLGAVVSSFGPPDAIDRHVPFLHETHPTVYSIELHYPKRGLNVGTSGNGSVQELRHGGELAVQLTEEMRVDIVYCYTPTNSMAEVLNPASSDSEARQGTLPKALPWPGFGAWVPLPP